MENLNDSGGKKNTNKSVLSGIRVRVLAVAFVFLMLVVSLFVLSGMLHKTKAKLEVITSQKEQLQQKVDKISSEKTELEHEIFIKKSENNKLKLSLDEESKKLVQSKQELEFVRTELERINSLYESEKKERTNLAVENIKLREDSENAKNSLDQLTLAKSSLEQKLKEITSGKSKKNDGVVGVKDGVPVVEVIANGQDIVADILTVNREYNFVVINLGRNNAIKESQLFNVFRSTKKGSTFIGKIQVQKVYDEMSAADILSEEPNQTIQKGDVAQAA